MQAAAGRLRVFWRWNGAAAPALWSSAGRIVTAEASTPLPRWCALLHSPRRDDRLQGSTARLLLRAEVGRCRIDTGN
jgi:hypothetical protein